MDNHEVKVVLIFVFIVLGAFLFIFGLGYLNDRLELSAKKELISHIAKEIKDLSPSMRENICDIVQVRSF